MRKISDVQLIVNHFFEIKGWNKERTEERNYNSFLRTAKKLLVATKDVEKAKALIDEMKSVASENGFSWSLETIHKRWSEVNSLKHITVKKPVWRDL